MMKRHEFFEWDPGKAKANSRKHQGVTFDDAAAVLGDDQGDTWHLEEYDDAHSIRELRYITTGSHPDNRHVILVVCWTDRSKGDKRITRIISARRATPRERKRYAKEIGGQ